MTRHLPEQTRREQILMAARKCFIEKGFHPTRMEDIAAQAGLSKGGVYFHFESKQEVFEALVREEFESSMAFLKGVMDGPAPIAEKMQAIGGHYMQYFTSTPEATRFFIVMGEAALRDEAVRAHLLEKQTAFIDVIATLVDQGVAEGVLRPVDTRAVSALLKALLDGVEGLQALGVQVDLTRLMTVGLDLVLRGLVATPIAAALAASGAASEGNGSPVRPSPPEVG